MTRSIALFLITVACCISFDGQTPVASPPPADEKDVVKITTSLIQVDVTVTDRKGNMITDLKPDEIEVYENGEKQKITNFSFMSNIQTRETVESKRERNTVVQPPTAIRPEEVRRTIAIVVDDLTLSFESTHFVRRALKKFVDEQMQSGDLVAIIRTGAGIGALQQFTNDKRQLHAAIERVRWNAIGSGNIGAFPPIQGSADTGGDAFAIPSGPGERTADAIERENSDFREGLFATGTLGAVNYVIRGMQELPGRKSIMLLSDGFRLYTRDATGTREYGRVLNRLRRLIDMANRASVVIYTLDARGLQVTGVTAADSVSVADFSFEEFEQAASDRREQLFDTQDGLKYLAHQTGGTAIVNTNDLGGGIRKILDDQSYYLIAYEPDDATFDPRTRRFNKLEIKVKRPGTRVRYRSGFFGVSDEGFDAPPRTPEERIRHAITSPFAVSDVSLHLNALFFDAGKVGSTILSLLHIKAGDLTFKDEPDGTKSAEFDLVAIGFGDNGVPVEQTGKSYSMKLKPAAYDWVMKNGFVYRFSMPIKKPGAYQLRVALRDRRSDKVGSANQFVEVPNLKKNRLVLSGVMLQTSDFREWQEMGAGRPDSGSESDALTDTSLRQFKPGKVLNYGFSIYNARSGSNLSYRIRIFRDGKPVFEGKSQPVPPAAGPDPKTRDLAGALALGSAMVPGDYVLQIVVTDGPADPKRNTATQFVQFEIVEL